MLTLNWTIVNGTEKTKYHCSQNQHQEATVTHRASGDGGVSDREEADMRKAFSKGEERRCNIPYFRNHNQSH
jgi:hypothetical protein